MIDLSKCKKHFNKSQLKAGTKVEMEHTKNPYIAERIAKQHLCEHSSYYKALAKMEAKLRKI